MVYGIIKLINFAHCDIYMIGAYVGFYCLTLLNLGFVPSLLIAMAICTALGVAIEKIAYKPLRNSPRIAVLITAIGVSLFLEYGMVALVGAGVQSYPEMSGFFATKINLDNIAISMMQIVIVGVSVLDDPAPPSSKRPRWQGDACGLLDADAALDGHKCRRNYFLYVYAGFGFAGAAGVMVGMLYKSIRPLMGHLPGIRCLSPRYSAVSAAYPAR